MNHKANIRNEVDILLYAGLLTSLIVSFFMMRNSFVLYAVYVSVLATSILELKMFGNNWIDGKSIISGTLFVLLSAYVILYYTYTLKVIMALSIFFAIVAATFMTFLYYLDESHGTHETEYEGDLSQLPEVPDDIPPKWKEYFESIDQRIKKVSMQVSMAITMKTLDLNQSLYNTYSVPEYESVRNSLKILSSNMSNNELFIVDFWNVIVEALENYLKDSDISVPPQWVLTPVAQVSLEVLSQHRAVFGKATFSSMKHRHKKEIYYDRLQNVVEEKAKATGIAEAALLPISDVKTLKNEVSTLSKEIDGIGSNFRRLVTEKKWDTVFNQIFSGTSKYIYSREGNMAGTYKSEQLRTFFGTYDRFVKESVSGKTDKGMVLTPLYAWIFIFSLFTEVFSSFEIAQDEMEELKVLHKSR